MPSRTAYDPVTVSPAISVQTLFQTISPTAMGLILDDSRLRLSLERPTNDWELYLAAKAKRAQDDRRWIGWPQLREDQRSPLLLPIPTMCELVQNQLALSAHLA
jgi:hypothetical protein